MYGITDERTPMPMLAASKVGLDGEAYSQGVPGPLRLRQQNYADRGESQRRVVAPRAQADESQYDRADKFDRCHERQGQAADREIEAAVHDGETCPEQ